MSDWKRQRVASPFIANSKIVAGFSPLTSVRGNAFTPGAKLGEQMCQFMEKCTLDLFGAVLMQHRV